MSCRRVQVTASQLQELLTHTSSYPLVHSLLLEQLPANVRVISPPIAPPSLQLANRLAALQTRVGKLSETVSKKREEARITLEISLKKAHADLQNIPTPDKSSNIENLPPYQPTAPISNQLQQVQNAASDTLTRVNRVKGVLDMLGEDVDEDVSRTIVADWSDTFQDLARVSLIRKSSRKRTSNKMLSPFVTPRSKMRRRVARRGVGGEVVRTLQLPR